MSWFCSLKVPIKRVMGENHMVRFSENPVLHLCPTTVYHSFNGFLFSKPSKFWLTDPLPIFAIQRTARCHKLYSTYWYNTFKSIHHINRPFYTNSQSYFLPTGDRQTRVGHDCKRNTIILKVLKIGFRDFSGTHVVNIYLDSAKRLLLRFLNHSPFT